MHRHLRDARAHPLRFARAAVWWARYRRRPVARRQPRRLRYRGCTFELFPDEEMAWWLVSRGEFEAAEMDAFLPFVEPGSRCVDVGANAGVYAVQMAKLGGRVVAFEPHPTYQRLLLRNAARNGVRLDLVPKAVSASPGKAELSVSRDGGFSSLHPTGRHPETHRIPVVCTTLDEILPPAEPSSAWKIDVEGAELDVLRGATRLLGDPALRPRAILVELNAQNQQAFGVAPGDVVKFLLNLDYEPWSITSEGPLRGWPSAGAGEDVLFLAPGARAPRA